MNVKKNKVKFETLTYLKEFDYTTKGPRKCTNFEIAKNNEENKWYQFALPMVVQKAEKKWAKRRDRRDGDT